jgi:hypothetical protein
MKNAVMHDYEGHPQYDQDGQQVNKSECGVIISLKIIRPADDFLCVKPGRRRDVR